MAQMKMRSRQKQGSDKAKNAVKRCLDYQDDDVDGALLEVPPA